MDIKSTTKKPLKLAAAIVIGATVAGCGTTGAPLGPQALNLSASTEPIATISTEPTELGFSAGGTPKLRGAIDETLALTSNGESEATADEFTGTVNDPLEPIGRGFHQLNRGVDFVVMRPVTAVYNTVLPRPLRSGIRNGFRHLKLPVHFANYVLQGEMEQAGNTVARALVNTTIGLGGILDPAGQRDETSYRPTDFGVTLGKWGVGEGIYFEAPLLGPTTTRASIGRIVDIAFHPVSYVTFWSDMGSFSAVDAVSPAYRVAETIEQRARNADLVNEILYASPDTYVTLRTVYVQNRRSLLSGGEVTDATLPESLEFAASTD
ncbi:MAG: VacJ family lipoprotein [Pseudomonadota bacterium]